MDINVVVSVAFSVFLVSWIADTDEAMTLFIIAFSAIAIAINFTSVFTFQETDLLGWGTILRGLWIFVAICALGRIIGTGGKDMFDNFMKGRRA